MTPPVEFLDVDDLIDLARSLLGDPPPIRDVGLLGSAAARPQTTVFGQDAYPELIGKAAALLQSIVNNHPLVDGNKRLGWIALVTTLAINDIVLDVDDDEEDVDELPTGLLISCSISRRTLPNWNRNATSWKNK